MTGKAEARNEQALLPPGVTAACEPIALWSATRTDATGEMPPILADGRWRLGPGRKHSPTKIKKTNLTPTGLLMEGDYTNNRVNECNGDISTVINFAKFSEGNLRGLLPDCRLLGNFGRYLLGS
jgi:hypothetical protein